MNLYSEDENYKLYQGNMLNLLEVIDKNSIDVVLTDPPYELNFMGKGWDNSGIAFQSNTWEQCFKALKEGGYLLAFGGSRTFHRIACAIEDAGFEVRDTIMWLYGSGFPKSMNIGLAIDKKNGIDNRTGKIVKGVGSNNTNSMKNGLGESQEFKSEYEERIPTNEWNGWGTCLKPAFEPVIVARKPFKGSLVDNVINNGVGGLNIDECRVGNEERTYKGAGGSNTCIQKGALGNGTGKDLEFSVNGRFPANVILTYDDTDYEEVCGGFPNSKDGSNSRYYYTAKASKKDRDEGLDEFEEEINCDRDINCYSADVPFNRSALPKKNTHPTVKPTDLMQYLVRLVTPKGGVILDPFNGSGSTGKAVMYENKERQANYKYIGIEITEEYLPIAKARIEYVENLKESETKEYTIFDYIKEE